MKNIILLYLTEKNRAKNKYKKPDKYLENPDVIVIGSGIGGLGIFSILAQKKKWKTIKPSGWNWKRRKNIIEADYQ